MKEIAAAPEMQYPDSNRGYGAVAIGQVCAVSAALLLRNLLFGVEASDAAALLGAASFAATPLPVRRAINVNPVEALRAE